MKTRVVRASLAIIIMLALVWTPAISFAGETKVPHATGVKPAANSATPDSWEDDDTQGTAHSHPPPCARRGRRILHAGPHDR